MWHGRISSRKRKICKRETFGRTHFMDGITWQHKLNHKDNEGITLWIRSITKAEHNNSWKWRCWNNSNSIRRYIHNNSKKYKSKDYNAWRSKGHISNAMGRILWKDIKLSVNSDRDTKWRDIIRRLECRRNNYKWKRKDSSDTTGMELKDIGARSIINIYIKIWKRNSKYRKH